MAKLQHYLHYKDILSLENINKPEKIVRLLKALAFQVGSQVSYNEVGQLVGFDSKTVEQLYAYEFKWNDKKSNVRVPESFAKTYPEASFQVITPKNVDEFLL